MAAQSVAGMRSYCLTGRPVVLCWCNEQQFESEMEHAPLVAVLALITAYILLDTWWVWRNRAAGLSPLAWMIVLLAVRVTALGAAIYFVFRKLA